MATPTKIQKVSSGQILSVASNKFFLDIYQHMLPKITSMNLVFSPFCLHCVLGMICQGARNETKTEIMRLLKFGTDQPMVDSYQSVINDLQTASASNAFTLLFTNKAYCQEGFGLKLPFRECLRQAFHTEFEQLDFSTPQHCDEAVLKVNTFVATATDNKITDVIDHGTLEPNTSLLLVSAIYFKGFWEHSFNPHDTSKQLFFISDTKEVIVDMMWQAEYLQYRKLPDMSAELVVLPYKGGRLSMTIVLPNKGRDGGYSLKKIQDEIGTLVNDDENFLRKTLHLVSLSLPKFKMEATVEQFPEVLKQLGMKYIFSPSQADFGAIPREGAYPDICVSKVVHKAFVEVDEEGDHVKKDPGFRHRCQKTIVFIVDRPFYYQIVDHENDDFILFSGYCNDPTK